MINNLKAVIFDCDGVLFETTKANTAYYNTILEHLRQPYLTVEQKFYGQMATVDQTMEYLFQHDQKLLDAAQTFRKGLSYQSFFKFMEPDPDLETVLKSLRSGFKTGIVTNRTDTMTGLLEEFRLETAFDLVITALDATPKPAPDGLNKIMEAFKLTPSEVIYIGDSQLDQKAAQAANVAFIACKNTDLNADFHITGLGEIKNILRIDYGRTL